MADHETDILIVGGGAVGLLLMLAFRHLRYRVLLIDENDHHKLAHSAFDARSLALSPASMRVLQMLNVWDQIAPYITPIQTVHVSQQRTFGCTRIEGEQDAPLGCVIEMRYLSQILHGQINPQTLLIPAKLLDVDKDQKSVTVDTADGQCHIRTKLLIAADGVNSMVRKQCGMHAQYKPYHQHAIVANIGLARSHHMTAYERFLSNGTIALLPLSEQRAALIWAMPSKEAAEYMLMSDDAFLKALQLQFGYRLGRFLKVGARTSFLLQQVVMPNDVMEDWIVFIGNAAHTLHPIAGQGFNLSVRDVAALAQCITQYGIDGKALSFYHQMRDHDKHAMVYLTNTLVTLFSASFPGLPYLRASGLMAFNHISFLKQLFLRYAQGFGGHSPDLVCHIPLTNKDVL